MPAATTLDYRRPATRDAAQASIAAAVNKRELAYRAAAWSMLFAGSAALLLGLLFVAALVGGMEMRLAPRWHVPWAAQFLIIAGVVAPLLFWWEQRTRGRWFEDEVRAQGTTLAELWQCSSRGEWELRTTAAGGAAVCEVLLWGPRMILAARDRWRDRNACAVITEAVAMIHYLRHFDGGIEVRELPSIRRGPVLRYLVSRDWVGVSKKCDRVWLLTDARRTLGMKAV